MRFIKGWGNFLETNKKEKLEMIRLLRYIMKVFYANENYAKYGMPGMNYFMALIMATFYIMITGFMILFIFTAIYPDLYKYYLNVSSKIPSILSAIVLLTIIFFLLRIGIKEDSLKDSSFTKEYVNKAVNYLIAYGFTIGVIIVFLGLKFLPHDKSHV
jgi:hypothetical protein